MSSIHDFYAAMVKQAEDHRVEVANAETPGPLLDERVARNIMGLTAPLENQSYGGEQGSMYPTLQVYHYWPHYSTEMGTAWRVVEKMSDGLFSKRRQFFSEWQRLVSEAPHGAILDGKRIAWPDVLIFTTPLHICLAALLTSRPE